MLHFCRASKYIMKLSAVRKVLETPLFLALGSFGTLGPKLSQGTSLKFADVRTHLRKVLKMTLYILRITVLEVSLFILKFSNKLFDSLREFIGFLGIE